MTERRRPVWTACVNVSREDVQKTARLAQLELKEEELGQATKDFQNIVTFFDSMNELDVDGVEPMARPHDSENVMREDVPVQFNDVDSIMDEAPLVERDFIRVPKISSESSD